MVRAFRASLLATASVAFGLLALGVTIAGCGGDSVTRISTGTPAINLLNVPPVLEARMSDGVAEYELSLGLAEHDYDQGRPTPTYAYNGQSVLGPTLRIRRGDSVAIGVTNNLPVATTTHWHGADLPPDDDGGPHSLINPGDRWVADFDVIQEAATLWYHPHRKDVTAEHVYRGAAGFLIVDDDNPTGSLLPNAYGVDDIPIVLQDRAFTESGELDFGIDESGRGKRDPVLTVNGTLDPYIEVAPGLVRLRLLNGSQARFYTLGVTGSAMHKIASDGGYLNEPVQLEELTLGPGDRAEIVIEVGDDPVALTDDAFGRVVELRSKDGPRSAGTLPATLNAVKEIPVAEVVRERAFDMSQVGEGWGINGRQMDIGRIDERIRFGDTELWTLTAESGQHVFHVHQTQFQIVSINGEPPAPEDAGWEDSVWVNGDRDVEIIARFNTFADPDTPYMFHCHVLDHEDLGMMGQFIVEKT